MTCRTVTLRLPLRGSGLDEVMCAGEPLPSAMPEAQVEMNE